MDTSRLSDTDGRRTLTSTIDDCGLPVFMPGGDTPGTTAHIVDALSPPGAIGRYPTLSRASRDAGQLCQAHHIIQNAAVREVDGYSYSTAPAIILTREGHAEATRIQNGPAERGTYGRERDVADAALRAAGMAPRVGASLSAADRYFRDRLGLRLDSPTRVPG